MKKTTIALLSVLFVSAIACKRDDNNQPQQKPLSEIIVGGWELTKMDVSAKANFLGQQVDIIGTGSNFTGVATFKANPQEISSTASATVGVKIVLGGTEIPFDTLSFENVFDLYKYSVLSNQQIRLIGPEQDTINIDVKAYTENTIEMEFVEDIPDETTGQVVKTTFKVNVRKK